MGETNFKRGLFDWEVGEMFLEGLGDLGEEEKFWVEGEFTCAKSSSSSSSTRCLLRFVSTLKKSVIVRFWKEFPKLFPLRKKNSS